LRYSRGNTGTIIEVNAEKMLLSKKNITGGFMVALLGLFNLVVIYYSDRVIDWVSWQLHGRFFSFLAGTLFFVALFCFNYFLFFRRWRKRLKRIIPKYLLQTKALRESAVFLFTFLFLFCAFLFRLWNIDLIVEQRYRGVAGVLGPVFRFGKNMLDESRIIWGNSLVQTRNAEVLNTGLYDNYGRFVRTYRWHQTIRKAEQRYRIEENLLAGLIMQESMGNPLELNSGDDGGAGLMMFQPGTARQYGLKTYGNSKKTGRDVAHGRQLRNLVIQKKFSYTELSRLDERFHVEKSVNAGARFLSELYERHSSWDKAISAYNKGTPSAFPAATRHVRQVRHFQDQYASFLKKQK